MNQVDKKDVPDVVNPPKPDGTVVNPDGGGDDKDKNFAELRRQLKEKEDEIARLKSGKTDDDSKPFELGNLPEPDKKDPANVALRQVFERDLKEATLQWTGANKVTPEQWQEIRKNVRLTGTETLTEIKNAISKEYHALPSVREEREKALKEEGKKEAMNQHFDDETSLPGGGHGGAGGGQGNTRIPKVTRDWGKRLGLTDKELEAVDPEADSNDWAILDPAYKQQ